MYLNYSIFLTLVSTRGKKKGRKKKNTNEQHLN